MDEIKQEFKLGGLFDGDISKDDPFIQKIKHQFLTNPNIYIETEKPDDWFCSDIFTDYQYRNKNNISDLSWIRHSDTFKYYFRVIIPTNENLVYSMYLELYDLVDEFYDSLIKRDPNYKPTLFRVDIDVKDKKKFVEMLPKYNIDITDYAPILKKWNLNMLIYFFRETLIYERQEYAISDVALSGDASLIRGYLETMYRNIDSKCKSKTLRDMKPVIKQGSATIFKEMYDYQVPIDNKNNRPDAYCTTDIYELLNDIPTPQMFVTLYELMIDKRKFLKDVKNALQHPDLKISEEFKKYITIFLEMMFIE